MRASVGGAPTFFRLFFPPGFHINFVISLLINSLESCRPKPVAGRHLRSQPQICVAASMVLRDKSISSGCSFLPVAGHDMLQLTFAVTDYLLILLLFQLYSCVCRSLRSSSASFHQPHDNLSDHMPSDSSPLSDTPYYGQRRMPIPPVRTQHDRALLL